MVELLESGLKVSSAFLERRLSHFQIKAYALDPTKLKEPVKGQSRNPKSFQLTVFHSMGDPLERLIRINEIRALKPWFS